MKEVHRKRIIKWVEALESGEYDQTNGVLMRPGEEHDSFCCLGVACDLHAIEKGDGWGYDSALEEHTYLGQPGLLPLTVRKYFGLDFLTGTTIPRGNSRVSLIILNDDMDFTFVDIAAVIRKFVLKENIKLSDHIKEALK